MKLLRHGQGIFLVFQITQRFITRWEVANVAFFGTIRSGADRDSRPFRTALSLIKHLLVSLESRYYLTA